MTALGTAGPAVAAPNEYEVKAAFLYNFAKFTAWPDPHGQAEHPFTICILGDDPFGPALDLLKGKPPLLEHRIVTMRLSPGEVRSSQSGAAGLSAARRAHLVCGHYVVRGGKVFWRRSHMRGGRGTGPDEPKTFRVVV